MQGERDDNTGSTGKTSSRTDEAPGQRKDVASSSACRRPTGCYEPLFVEETWIVKLHGTNEENERFDDLMANRDDRWNRIEIVMLVEHIKERNKLGLGSRCCPACPHYRTCRLNWRRGELDLPRTCCSNCPGFNECMRKKNRRKG